MSGLKKFLKKFEQKHICHKLILNISVLIHFFHVDEKVENFIWKFVINLIFLCAVIFALFDHFFHSLNKKLRFPKMESSLSLNDRRIAFLIIFVIATLIFCYHSYTIFNRFVQFEVNESVITKRNSSLILPAVHLQFITKRNTNDGMNENLKKMLFLAYLGDEVIPDWAYTVKHDDSEGIHEIVVNRVSRPVCFTAKFFNFELTNKFQIFKPTNKIFYYGDRHFPVNYQKLFKYRKFLQYFNLCLF